MNPETKPDCSDEISFLFIMIIMAININSGRYPRNLLQSFHRPEVVRDLQAGSTVQQLCCSKLDIGSRNYLGRSSMKSYLAWSLPSSFTMCNNRC